MTLPDAPHLELSDAAIMRGERLLFQHVSFQLPAGGRLWLRGQNGAGKSSLIRAISGFVPLAAGSLTLGGETFLAGTDARLPVQLVGHDNGLNPMLTANQNLSYAAALIKASLPFKDKFQIADFGDRPVRSLSAGQIQRVALSRLCLSPPPDTPRALWLLDEPDAPLDTDNRTALYSLIDAHCQQGGRVILAAHRSPENPATWSKLNCDGANS